MRPLLLLALFLVGACQRPADRHSVKLKHFKGFPPEVSGCSCFFAGSEKEIAREQYLFVSDLDSAGFISIEGKLSRLRLQRSDAAPDDPWQKRKTEVFTNEYYKLIIRTEGRESSADEVWEVQGTMQLFFKENPVDSVRFIGECGC